MKGHYTVPEIRLLPEMRKGLGYAQKGEKCYDCKSPDRICRGLSVLWEKPTSGEFEVILVCQDLGF